MTTGDRILDNLEAKGPANGSARAALAAQPDGCGPNNIYCPIAFSGLARDLEGTVNVNAGSTAE